jgi:MFS family permease
VAGARVGSPATLGRRFYYGWAVTAAAFSASVGAVVFFNPILGVFVTPLEAEFGWSRAQISLALTLGGFAAAFASPGVGAILDRHGGRWVVPPSAVVMTLLLVGLSRINALWQLLLLYSVGRALAVGAVQAAAFVAVSNWFIRRRSLAVALVALGSRLAMAALPLLAALVIEATGNWRDGWLALAVVIAAVGIVPPLLFMHRRPEDRGLRPDGDEDGASTEGPEPAALETDFSLREAARTRAYWLVGLAIALLMFCGGSINFHQIPYLVGQGLEPTEAALVVAVFSLVGAAGGLIGGAIATRATVRWTMVVTMLGQAIGVLVLLGASDVTGGMTYAVVYGVFFGGTVTLNQVIYADYFGRRSLGVIRGSFQPVQMTFNAVGPFAVGLWFERAGSYDAAWVAFAVLFVVAALCLVLSPQPHRAAPAASSKRRAA